MKNAADELYEYIMEKFGENYPIFYSEIKYKDYSDIWKSKQLSALLKAQRIKRFNKGIYYVPQTTNENGGSFLNSRKVVVKKYMNDGSNVFGYYSGYSFLHWLGLTTQVPNLLEIYTNNETSKVREVKVGNAKVLLRKTRVLIDSSNAAVLSFLELMNFIEPSYINEYRFRIIEEFIKVNKITKKDITKYAPYFPDKAMRTLIESEVIYCVA